MIITQFIQYFFVKDKIEDWQYYHELGHGIIASIFDGYICDFKGITFIKSDLEQSNNLHADDLGYTITRPVNNLAKLMNNDTHKVPLIDGLLLLSGAAGAASFGKNTDFSNTYILPSELDLFMRNNGATRDLEHIQNANRTFGWLVKNRGINDQKRKQICCKLSQILLELFESAEMKTPISKLLKKLKYTKRLSPEDFREHFGCLLEKMKSQLLRDISIDEFGPLC